MDQTNPDTNQHMDLSQPASGQNMPPTGTNIGSDAATPGSSADGSYSGLHKGLGGLNKTPSRHDSGFGISMVLNYLLLIITVVASILMVVLIIIPQYHKYVENTAKVAETKAELDKVSLQLEYLQGLSSLQNELEGNLELSRKAIPLNEDIPQLLNQVSIIANNSSMDLLRNDFSGVTANNLQVDGTESTDATKAKSVNVKAQLTGTYSSVISFLQNLESAQRLQSISDLQISEFIPSETASPSTVAAETEIDPLLTDLSSKTYEVTVTLVGYHMDDPSLDSLPIEDLVAKGDKDFVPIITKLAALTYYELDFTQLETIFGRDDPFVPSGFNATEEEQTQLQLAPTPTPIPTEEDEEGSDPLLGV